MNDHPYIIPTIWVKFGQVFSDKKIFENRPIPKKRISPGDHVFCSTEMKIGMFVKDHPYIITTQFGQIQPSSFRGDDF